VAGEVVPVPTVCPSTLNVTVPGAFMVAVRVAGWPATTGLGETVTVVVVAAAEAWTGWACIHNTPTRTNEETQHDFPMDAFVNMERSMEASP
jgi:hypothetical protein